MDMRIPEHVPQNQAVIFVWLVGKSKGSETEHLAFDKPQLRLRRPVRKEPPSPSHDEGQD
jgi:hypothetical protein